MLNTSKGSPSSEEETFERSSLEVSYEKKRPYMKNLLKSHNHKSHMKNQYIKSSIKIQFFDASYEKVETTYVESTWETSKDSRKCSCKDQFETSSKYYNEASSRRSTKDKEEHVFLKATYEEDDNKVTSLTYKLIFKLSVKRSK